MIEPTTSTTSGAAADADQDAAPDGSSRSGDLTAEQATRSNADEQATTEPAAAEHEVAAGVTSDEAGAQGDATGRVPEEPEESETQERSAANGAPADDPGEGQQTPSDTAEPADSAEPAEAEPEESEADKVARLEREGDIAADYLEELLDIADMDGDIDLDVEGDRAVVAVVGGDLKRLTGSDGSVLDALQELTRLAVLRETGNRSRLMLDVGGFRARRRQDLQTRAAKVADEVSSSGNPVRMDPMTPFERKIVHDTVAERGLTSESEGEEPNRRVVVKPQ